MIFHKLVMPCWVRTFNIKWLINCGRFSLTYLYVFLTPSFAIQSITVTSYYAPWRLKSPASRLFAQTFVQAQLKETIKAPRHWPLSGECWPVESPHKGPVTRKMFPFDDVINNPRFIFKVHPVWKHLCQMNTNLLTHGLLWAMAGPWRWQLSW